MDNDPLLPHTSRKLPSLKTLWSSFSSSSSSLLDPTVTSPPPEMDPPPTPLSWLIDPNYTWTKTNLHRSKTAPAMAVSNDVAGPTNKPQMSSQLSIVRQAVIYLAGYLSLGVVIYWFNRDDFDANESYETHPAVDALYFCIVTMCTIGYGDITPKTMATKLFSMMFVLVGFGFVDMLLSGMVSYVLDLLEGYLLKSLKNVGERKKRKESYIIDVKKGRMKVGMALGVVVICVGVGAMVMHYVEDLGWVDSFYLSVMSVTTVGYGDRAFQSVEGRMFASIWLLVSTLMVARAFLYLAEARVDKRHRRMAKWVLGQDMTISQFLAADIGNHGFVSDLQLASFCWLMMLFVYAASQTVIYKLKEMGKVSEKGIMQISDTFDRLDAGNCGKITLADLMSRH